MAIVAWKKKPGAQPERKNDRRNSVRGDNETKILTFWFSHILALGHKLERPCVSIATSWLPAGDAAWMLGTVGVGT